MGIDGNGLSFGSSAVARWGRQVNAGIAAAASADASMSWMAGGSSSNSADTFYPSGQVVASGVDAKGLAWYQYDTGAESHAVADPVIEVRELPPSVQGGGLLAEGRASMNAYWSRVADDGVSEGSFLKYLAGQTMQKAGSLFYDVADMSGAAYNDPRQAMAGGVKSLINFGPDAFNFATNTLKTSLNGYSLLAEKFGAGEGTFAGFRESDPYNITPLFGYDNQAQAGGALFTQVALGAGLAKYGNYRVELNLGEPGVVYSNPMPLRLVPPDLAEGARFGNAVSNDYRGTFFATYPELQGQVVVHHAVEQQVLKRYPGVVSEGEMNSLENLRGIPKDVNSQLHLSAIRREWNQFYRQNPSATQAQLLEKATQIDAKYGTQFNPPVGGR